MRLKPILLACTLLATPLGACANLPTFGLVPASSSTPHTGQTKAFIAAEQSIGTAVQVVTPLLQNGTIHGEKAAQVGDILKALKVLDQTAYDAYFSGNTVAGDNATAGIVGLVAQLYAIVASAKHGS